ncbi:MAG TPA: hypothetical protein VD971_01210 [Phycisphaerales bacterium]|nr:hypothetical protein [Phycisphaerales bacterium]
MQPRAVFGTTCALMLAAGGASAAITVTRTTTFNPGWFFPNFTYAWTINVPPIKGPYNDYEVWNPAPGWAANLDTASYAGPGAIGGPQPAGGIRVITLAPGGFTPPTSGSIDSIANPKFVAGRLTFQITLAGVPVNAAVVASLPVVPGNSTTTAGSTTVAYAAGAFTPNSVIDLFQSTALAGYDAHLGTAIVMSDGSMSCSLNRPLLDPASDELVFGIDGTLVGMVPAPGSASVLVGFAWAAARRRR